jgi:hypothetical protein
MAPNASPTIRPVGGRTGGTGPVLKACNQYLYGLGSFHHRAKKVIKTLISTVFVTFNTYTYFIKTDVNVLSKSNEQKNLKLNIFVGIRF